MFELIRINDKLENTERRIQKTQVEKKKHTSTKTVLPVRIREIKEQLTTL